MPRRRQQDQLDLMRYADLGIRLALIAGVFLYGGWRLDEWLGTGPWLLLLGCVLGFGGGMYSVVKAVESMGRRRSGGAGPQDEPRAPDGEEPRDERP